VFAATAGEEASAAAAIAAATMVRSRERIVVFAPDAVRRPIAPFRD
jgi:hypothetical protein